MLFPFCGVLNDTGSSAMSLYTNQAMSDPATGQPNTNPLIPLGVTSQPISTLASVPVDRSQVTLRNTAPSVSTSQDTTNPQAPLASTSQVLPTNQAQLMSTGQALPNNLIPLATASQATTNPAALPVFILRSAVATAPLVSTSQALPKSHVVLVNGSKVIPNLICLPVASGQATTPPQVGLVHLFLAYSPQKIGAGNVFICWP